MDDKQPEALRLADGLEKIYGLKAAAMEMRRLAAGDCERVSAWMMQRGYATGHGDTIEDLLEELDWQARESEREACAKECEVLALSRMPANQNRSTVGANYLTRPKTADECAASIRARGNHDKG